MHIGLVAHVEDELVGGRVEDVVHGEGQLDHAQVRPEMPARPGQGLDQPLANLLASASSWVSESS
jgi:hypothetical protein